MISLSTSLLFLFTSLLVFLSFLLPKHDKKFAFVIAAFLMLASGLRASGYDFDEYLTIISNVRTSKVQELDLSIRLIAGKDLLMILIVDLVSLVESEKTWPIFLFFSTLSVGFKVIATNNLKSGASLFLGINTIFLSPTIEFSAIRSAVGTAVMLFTLSSNLKGIKQIPFLLLASISHFSNVIPSVLCFFTSNTLSRKILISTLFTTMLVGLVGSNILLFFSRNDSYIGKSGSIYALLFPLASLLLYLPYLLFFKIFDYKLNFILIFCLGLSVGLALPSVGISHRLLEISLTFYTFILVKNTYIYTHKERLANSIILFLLLLLLTLRHLYEGNWAAIQIF